MKQAGGLSVLAAVALLIAGADASWAGATNEAALSYQEVFALISSNLPSAAPAELNRAAALGLINQLEPQVQLISGNDTNRVTSLPVKSSVIEKSYAVIRLSALEAPVATDFKLAFQGLSSTNKLKGLVLDLRFCSGRDYKAATEIADRFVATAQPLFTLEGTNIQSTVKSDAITLPLALLVNSQTSGASELLSALLRQIAGAVVIGSPTAGGARIFEEYPLSTGQKLRIAKSDLQLPGGRSLTAGGIVPDISIRVPSDEERAYLDDPYKNWVQSARDGKPGGGTNDAGSAVIATNRAMRRNFNEAELVRRHREGLDMQGMMARIEDNRATLGDPALGRAIDFLKGLAVVQRFGKSARE
ncbi:MAG: C-terminal processing peptidase [Verrucomicrobiales bacterium]|nr:C-terminal processing peptidase [Verrucomicrobiales bacterium]